MTRRDAAFRLVPKTGLMPWFEGMEIVRRLRASGFRCNDTARSAMRPQERIFGMVLLLIVLLNTLLTVLFVRVGRGFFRPKLTLLPVRGGAMTDLVREPDREACAREAATAIEAVLDQRCPELKRAFWRAVEKHYRLDPERSRRRAAGSS